MRSHATTQLQHKVFTPQMSETTAAAHETEDKQPKVLSFSHSFLLCHSLSLCCLHSVSPFSPSCLILILCLFIIFVPLYLSLSLFCPSLCFFSHIFNFCHVSLSLFFLSLNRSFSLCFCLSLLLLFLSSFFISYFLFPSFFWLAACLSLLGPFILCLLLLPSRVLRDLRKKRSQIKAQDRQDMQND